MSNEKPKSAKYKFAFTGTNSSGKTTLAMEVTSRLKSETHVLAELVSSQDRKISWRDEHFPVDPRAHYGMITNLIHAEVQAELKGDCTTVVTDRSVLDLYSIAKTDFPDNQLIKALESTVLAWLTTYTRIYYLPPLDYQEDGKRPSNEFRLRTHSTLLELIDKYSLDNLVKKERHEIMSDIRKQLNVNYSNPPLAETIKWQEIANVVNFAFIVKDRDWPSTSDYDVFILLDNIEDTVDVSKFHSLIIKCFGPEFPVHIMLGPKSMIDSIKFKYKEYKANGLKVELHHHITSEKLIRENNEANKYLYRGLRNDAD